MKTVRLKMKEIIHKNYILVDNVVAMEVGLTFWKPLYMYTGIKLPYKWMTDGKSQASH